MPRLSLEQQFANFRAEVERHKNLTAKWCSDVHWQVLGGQWLVNVYPTTRTFYVNGMSKSRAMNRITPITAFAQRCAEAARTIPKNNSGDNHANMSAQWRRTMKRRLWADGHVQCCWCRDKFRSVTDATLEHVVPMARGGSATNYANLDLACWACNQEHGGEGKFLSKDRKRDKENV